MTNTIECQISNGVAHSFIKTILTVAISYDGCHLISRSYGAVQIWDCHTGNEVSLYQNHWGVKCVAFSRDGGRVAFGFSGGTLRIWNPSMGHIHTLDNLSERGGWVHSIAFSNDGNHVISGTDDGIWIWNVTTNKVSTMVSERIHLPDGTRVHSLSKGNFHVYDPVDQDTTYGISPYYLYHQIATG